MYYIIEALLVGTYSTLLYLLYSPIDNIFNNIYITLLVVGFFKHYLSYYIGLHTFYCRYGEACKKYNLYIAKNNRFLLYESIFEAISYLLVGSIIYQCITNNKLYIFFSIGFILHIVFEYLQVHNRFCKERCSLNVIEKR
jgi:hypothetical protein